MSRLFLLVAGQSRAGKSEVCSHLRDEYDFTTILISNLIRAFASENGIVLSRRSDYLTTHNRMKAELGLNVFKDAVRNVPSDRVAVDGNRVPNDVRRFRNMGADAVSRVIALDCPAEVRFERARRLQTSLDPTTFEEFLKDDIEDGFSADPEKQGTLTVMSEADYHVDSSRPIPEVLADIDGIVVPLLG